MTTGKITPHNILHQNRNKKETKVTLDNLLDVASSDNVSDAMKNLYDKTGYLDGVKPLNPSHKVVGSIKTAYTDSNDWGTCIKAIYSASKDDVLLIKCSDDKYAVWGGMASNAAKKYGLKSTVIYGASRDSEDILNIDYKLFSRTTHSHAGKPLNNGEISDSIVINNEQINDGDILVGDRDGVVVIPKENLDEILEEVNSIKKFESDAVNQLKDKNLDTILGIE
ncbi:MAG: RraA family protein [Methanosphaera sp.]|nr:RraA family protein [Methanosphaera sp.]